VEGIVDRDHARSDRDVNEARSLLFLPQQVGLPVRGKMADPNELATPSD
jgi:hypothetical protein